MKKFGILAFTVFAIVLWLSQIYWMPKVSYALQYFSPDCQANKSGEGCESVIENSGAAGEALGSIGSLFAGLALVGVAITLYYDSKSRRADKKPLIVCYVTDDSVSLDSPNAGNPKSIRLRTGFRIANQGEAAINARVKVVFQAGSSVVASEDIHVQMPLSKDGAESVNFDRIIQGQSLEDFFQGITDGAGACKLNIMMSCESLEGMSWVTEVSYALKNRTDLDHKRLRALLFESDDLQSLWDGQAIVALRPSLVPGSWKYYSPAAGLRRV